MAAPFLTTGKNLAFLLLVGVAAPFAQAAEVPFPSLSPFPNQREPAFHGAEVGIDAAMVSPVSGGHSSLAPLSAGMSVEASEPQFIAQVLPSVGATDTQVSIDDGGHQF